jgi:hypothetical protein
LNGSISQTRWGAVLEGAPGVPNGPITLNLTTGLVFSAGEQVEWTIASPPNAPDWFVTWSGHVAPDPLSGLGENTETDLHQQFKVGPNPGQHHANLEFRLQDTGPITVAIFDVQGRRIRTLHEGDLSAGVHAISWDGLAAAGQKVSDGIYFALLETPQGSEVSKLGEIR